MTRWAILLELNYKPVLRGNISHWIRTTRTTRRLLQSYREHKSSSRLLHSEQGLIKQWRKSQQKFNVQPAMLWVSREFRKDLRSNLQLFSHKWSECRLQPQGAVFIRIFIITRRTLSLAGDILLSPSAPEFPVFQESSRINKADNADFQDISQSWFQFRAVIFNRGSEIWIQPSFRYGKWKMMLTVLPFTCKDTPCSWNLTLWILHAFMEKASQAWLDPTQPKNLVSSRT